MPRLKHGGKVEIAYLGADRRGGHGLTSTAWSSATLQPGGPAAEAGLAAGDVILSVAGVKVSSMGDALQIVQAHLPGQTVSIRRAPAGSRAHVQREARQPAR